MSCCSWNTPKYALFNFPFFHTSRPPLIPYMGLVLQDLTFVHIGNSDTVKGGKVNFAKRWQQYNILVSLLMS